ncbi:MULTISPECIES: helix-turn-helix domain-containing protein [Bacteria]|uniref:helix-turn-helix domain-containing protein n=1 Tax=Bacteria TaxID=2 RepID=UPI003C79B2CE
MVNGEGRTERRVALSGDAARRWVERNGFVPATNDDLRVAGDVIQRRDFLVVREWRSPARMRLPADVPADHAWFLFPLEGSVEHVSDSGSFHVRSEQDWMAIDPASPPLLVNKKPFAYTAVRTDREQFREALAMSELRLGTRLDQGDFGRCLISLLMTMFNSAITHTDPSFVHIVGSVRHLLTAELNASLLRDFPSGASPAPAGELQTFWRALTIIEEHYHESEFRIADLADHLGVSATYLNRAFARSGSTPLQHLERARLRTAQTLAENGTDRFLSRTEVARRSGFPSLRALQRALRKARARSADSSTLRASPPTEPKASRPPPR